jgi:translation elongation factor P/translation initiation factor 5A
MAPAEALGGQMPVSPPHDVRRGTVIEHDGRHWLVLSVDIRLNFYVTYIFTIQSLRGGPTRQILRFGGRDLMDVVPHQERVMEFVCFQKGEMLLLDPVSLEMVALPEARRDINAAELGAGAKVVVRYFRGHPLDVARLAESSDVSDLGPQAL